MKLIKLASITAVLLSLWSCQKEEISTNNEDSSVSAQTEIKSLMGIKNFPVVKLPDGTYSHGDIRIENSQFDDPNASEEIVPQTPEKGALALAGGFVRKWPNNTVVFRYDNSITPQMKQRFEESMNEWRSKTNVRFKERTNEADFVTVQSTGDECNCGYANLGQVRNRGVLAFGGRASVSVIMHEIGHTLGYIHEQNRSDRDNYVKVQFQNISNGAENQFFKSDRSINLTDKLDIESIMMYGSYTFSANRQPTIVDLNGNTYRRTGRLSAGDIAGTNQAYPSTGEEDEDEAEEEDEEDEDEAEEDEAEEDEAEEEEEEDEDEEDEEEENGNPTNPEPTNPEDVCNDVSAWSRGTAYRVGDRVTFRGYLFERDFSRWTLLQKCGTTKRNDICAGIENFNGGRYEVGDQVVFRGYLYTRVQGGWIREGQCGR